MRIACQYSSLDFLVVNRNRPPKPHEIDRFYEIYIDETSQTGHRFLIIGGIYFPYKYSSLFEQTILKARLPLIPQHHPNGQLRQIGWREFAPDELETYKRVVDAFHSFRQHLSPFNESIEFLGSIIDTHVRGRRYSGRAGKIGFDREIFYHCLRLGRRFDQALFHVYPDFRSVKDPKDLTRLRYMLNRGIKRNHDDMRDWPYRRMQFRTSHQWQALQVSDLFIGALAYRLNRHYDNPKANPKRKELCDYILRRAHLFAIFKRGKVKKWKDWGNFRYWFRQHRS
jgi:hypothetical protein